MKTRSVPRLKNHPIVLWLRSWPNKACSEFENVQGTLLGFLDPDFARVNVPGYHLHFLSDDRTRRPRHLDFTMDEGSCWSMSFEPSSWCYPMTRPSCPPT